MGPVPHPHASRPVLATRPNAAELIRDVYPLTSNSPGRINVKDAAFLLSVIDQQDPKSIIEIGVASGASSLLMLRMLEKHSPTASLTSVDAMARYYADTSKELGYLVTQNYSGHGDRWRLLAPANTSDFFTSAATPPSLPARTFDMAFIDANHDHPWPALDALNLLPFLQPASWIVFHDISLPIVMPEFQHYGALYVLERWPGEAFIGEEAVPNIGAIILTDAGETDADRLLSTIDMPWSASFPRPIQAAIIAHLTNFLNPSQVTRLEDAFRRNTKATTNIPLTPEPPPQGTEAALQHLQGQIGEFLRAALATNVVSQSSVPGVTITGNSYQSIRLGDATIGGFRSIRESLLNGFSLAGRTTCDLGANLGEVAREMKRRGAALVDAYEYDRFFNQQGQYITAYNNLPDVNHIAADVSRPGYMRRSYDVGVTLSSFAYVGQNLGEALDNIKELFIVETHEVGPGWVQNYVDRIVPTFPYWCCFGVVAHGDGTKQRLWLAFSKRELDLFYLDRARTKVRVGEGAVEVDLSGSQLPFLDASRDLIADARDHLYDSEFSASLNKRLNAIETSFQAGTPTDLSMSGEAYWLAFVLGLKDPERESQYATWLKRGIDRGHIDPGLRDRLGDAAALQGFCSDRLSYFSNRLMKGVPEDEPMTIAYNICADHAESTSQRANVLKLSTGRRVCAPNIDGHHRLFANAISGREECLMMTIWDLDYLRFLHPTWDKSYYQKAMVRFLSGEE